MVTRMVFNTRLTVVLIVVSLKESHEEVWNED